MAKCTFWYQLTRVVLDKVQRAVKWLCMCACVCVCVCVCLNVNVNVLFVDIIIIFSTSLSISIASGALMLQDIRLDHLSVCQSVYQLVGPQSVLWQND